MHVATCTFRKINSITVGGGGGGGSEVHSMCAHHVLSIAKACTLLSIYHVLVTVDYSVADMFLPEP